jgi:hypothetical protein
MNPMNPPSPTWAPVVASGIVGLCSLIGIWLAQRTTTRREHAAKEREAKEKRANRWDDFQMKTLMDLQDTLKELVVLPGRKLMAGDVASYQGNLKDSIVTLLQPSYDLATARLTALVLSARVPDAQLAKLVSELAGIARDASHTSSVEEHQPFMQPLMNTFAAANRRIGELLAALRPDHP